ncbi:hypothetical protein [Paenibacillus lutimineralis]|nr:hypothetical protein [Paenibacillus lutimineralis]
MAGTTHWTHLLLFTAWMFFYLAYQAHKINSRNYGRARL